MAALQDLDARELREPLLAAVDRKLPITVTRQAGDRWENLQSKLLAASDDRLWFQEPVNHEGKSVSLQAADRIGITFKLKHHKYIFMVTVAAVEDVPVGDGTSVRVVSTCWPSQMQRLQRRSYFRADVPAGHVVRASAWLGGRKAEPQGTSPDKPVFTGQVTNISAGGFQFATADPSACRMEQGDFVGARIAFGAADEVIFVDAQVRHVVVEDDGRTSIGFQFAGLEQTAEGKNLLRLISRKVSEYQREALRDMAPSDAKAAEAKAHAAH